MTFLLETLRIGLSSLARHKLRSFLTALGVIFGVAAVIVMVAVGEGSKRKALQEIAALGANNLILQSTKPPPSPAAAGSRTPMIEYGLRRSDLRRIRETVVGVELAVALKRVGGSITHRGQRTPAVAFATTPDLPRVIRIELDRGRFLSDLDATERRPVAVLGATVARDLYPLQDPVGSSIDIDGQAFQVVGVLKPSGSGGGGSGASRIGRDLDRDVYVPLDTGRSRFGDQQVRRNAGAFEAERVEVSQVILHTPDPTRIPAMAGQVRRLLEMDPQRGREVEMIVPRELLDQAERSQRRFNALMIAIASISLLVGGIGIMNIMLAAVTERTREIGIRRALGATRRDVVTQFLIETTLLSGSGGLIGVGVGVVSVMVLNRLPLEELAAPVLVPASIAVSFAVSALVGVVFGLYPAVKAAHQNPITALRHE